MFAIEKVKMAKIIVYGIKPLFPWSLISLGFLIAALVIGLSTDLPKIAYRVCFILAIVSCTLTTLAVAISMYKRAPRNSPAEVTWAAFVPIHFGTFCVTMTALLWIVFELGKISGRID